MQPTTFLHQLVTLSGIRDGDTLRSLMAAIVAIALLWFTAPRGRRWLARGPAVLLGLAILPLAAATLFPEEAAAAEAAASGARFFVLAALFQAIVLMALVSVWGRLVRPPSAILLDVLRWIAAAAAAAIILGEAGVEPGTLFAGSALVTAAVGFALRDTLGNVFSGLALQAERPFELGDWIQYDANSAHIGRVVEVNWRATRVITLDEAFVVIPNGQLGLASIRNFSKPDPWSRRSLFVVTPYDVPPQRVQAIILDAIRGSFGVLDKPPPSVVTNGFIERGVEHWVRFFTSDFDKRDRVDGMARDRIWYALARHGIEIPVATHAVRFTELPSPTEEPPSAGVDRRVECLSRIGLLAPFGRDLVRRVAEQNADRTYGTGEQVIREGDPGDSMFVIMSGGVEVTAGGDGGQVRIATLGPGDYFGEMSLMTGSPRVATVTTLGETRLLEVGKESFRSILAAHPELVEGLGRSLRLRMAERTQAIAGVERATPEVQDIFRKIRDFFAL